MLRLSISPFSLHHVFHLPFLLSPVSVGHFLSVRCCANSSAELPSFSDLHQQLLCHPSLQFWSSSLLLPLNFHLVWSPIQNKGSGRCFRSSVRPKPVLVWSRAAGRNWSFASAANLNMKVWVKCLFSPTLSLLLCASMVFECKWVLVMLQPRDYVKD